MIFNIFKTLLCAFLIFLSCFIADVRGKSITELKEINAAEFDLQELSSKVVQETTSEESVPVSIAGPCDPNPCENGGSCITRIDYVEGFLCYCPVGFAGKKCEIVEDNNCDRGDCENATCNCCPGWGLLADSCKECKCGKQFNCTFSPFGLEKTCLCGTGYTEEYGTCKADCKKNPCKNKGACLVVDYEVRCRCIELYEGEFCEKKKCDGMNCQNNGTCYIIEGIAVCACPDGYTGDNCEKHVCDRMNCQNNGTCYILDGKAVCKCPDGYTGDECEKLDLCSEVCGENPEVVCYSDKTKRDVIMCFCKDEDKIFDQEEKKCKVKEVDFADLCSEICGENPGVACVGDKPDRDAITCYCEDEDKIFDQQEKECKVNKVDLCSEVCGENPGVACEGDKTNRDAIMCFCEDEEKVFDQDEKDCKVKEVDLCLEICGESPAVLCEGDKTNRDNITCSCKEQDRIFDQEEKKCKIKKDMNTCFFMYWHVSWETAAKLCADENSTLLCYKTRKEMQDILESFRLAAIDNAKFAIWLGNRNNTREKKEMEKCLSLHVDKSDKTEWHYFQTNCDETNPFICCVDETNECDRMKCLNGGICNIIDGKAVCDCPIGYSGDVCEKHPCTNDPCLNGGQCIVTGTTFNCICKEPYFGKFCETNLCDQYICKNGGTCKVIREQPKCFCKEPYSGKFCDIRMDDCVTNFCENGGICRTMNGEPKCFCTEPYGGKFCNTRTDLRYNSTVFAVVYMLLGLVLISIGVLISCLLCRRICLGRK